MMVWEDSMDPASTQQAPSVLNIFCVACEHRLSWQGMRGSFRDDPSHVIFSSNSSPSGTTEIEYSVNHRMCDCRLHQFQCACGAVVGYHMHSWCANCQTNDDGHDWFFYAERVTAERRSNPATGELLFWQGREYEPSFNGSGQVTQDSIALPRSRPLGDRNGRQCQMADKPSGTNGRHRTHDRQKQLAIDSHKATLRIEETEARFLQEVSAHQAWQREKELADAAQFQAVQAE